MSKTWAIAINTFKEAVRNRILYVLLFFSVLILIGSWITATLSIEEPDRILRNLGVAAINIISGLIAVFVGIGLVYNELDKKTIYTIISKPISRWQFILGKYLGLLFTILVNVMIMTVLFGTLLYFRAYTSDEALTKAIYVMDPEAGGYVLKSSFGALFYYLKSILFSIGKALLTVLSLGYYSEVITEGLFVSSIYTMLEMAIVTAFAVLFSSFSTPTLSAFLTAIMWVIGKANEELYSISLSLMNKGGLLVEYEALEAKEKMLYWFAQGISHAAPNLQVFNIRESIAQNLPAVIDPYALSYCLVYSAGVLVISMMIFERRNFK